MKENNALVGAVMLITGLFLLIVMPIAIVWAIKTLFLVPIELTFETWCAALLLFGFIGNTKR